MGDPTSQSILRKPDRPLSRWESVSEAIVVEIRRQSEAIDRLPPTAKVIAHLNTQNHERPVRLELQYQI